MYQRVRTVVLSKYIGMAEKIFMLFQNITCFLFQIGDFGMARDLAYDNCYISSGGLVPVKWTAPEVYNLYLTDSSVGSSALL